VASSCAAINIAVAQARSFSTRVDCSCTADFVGAWARTLTGTEAKRVYFCLGCS
jgi:hypothetical protein